MTTIFRELSDHSSFLSGTCVTDASNVLRGYLAHAGGTSCMLTCTVYIHVLFPKAFG